MKPNRILSALSIRRISAAYVLLLIIIVFSLMRPDTFATRQTFNSVLNNQAITTLVAIAVVIPLSAGLFDLSVGAGVSISTVIACHLMVTDGHGILFSVIASLLVGALIGLINGLVLTKIRIDSFIVTLAMSSILLGLANAVSNQVTIVGLPNSFVNFGLDQFLGITYVVWAVAILAVLTWWLTSRTVLGRRLYATGGNLEAARLAGVPVDRVRVIALTLCGLLVAAAGVLLSAQASSGSSTAGQDYLMPAFAAAFLGSTQIKVGHVNVFGTVLAVYTLAAGVQGLQLIGAPFWISDAFNGAVLIIAVGLAKNPIGDALRRLRPKRAATGVETSVDEPANGVAHQFQRNR
jgi:ribose transport system permease protein